MPGPDLTTRYPSEEIKSALKLAHYIHIVRVYMNRGGLEVRDASEMVLIFDHSPDIAEFMHSACLQFWPTEILAMEYDVLSIITILSTFGMHGEKINGQYVTACIDFMNIYIQKKNLIDNPESSRFAASNIDLRVREVIDILRSPTIPPSVYDLIGHNTVQWWFNDGDTLENTQISTTF